MSNIDFSPEQLIAALRLPVAACIGRRVPKKMLADKLNAHGIVPSTDRKLIQEKIDELIWVAAIKPSNAGIPAYQDELRSYLELAVLNVRLRPGEALAANSAKIAPRLVRLTELIHRAIPYPVLLILDDGTRLYLSLAHIRCAQKEADKTVLDGNLLQGVFSQNQTPDALMRSAINPAINPAINADSNADIFHAFLSAMDLSKQPLKHLFSLYQGWMDTLSAWQAASVTGRFTCVSPEQAVLRRAALRRCQELDAQIASLRAAASKEKQIARQVAANLKMKELMAERQQTANSL